MTLQEEMTKLLMESYNKGVEDTKQEVIVALEKTVAIMVAAEREACAKVADGWPDYDVEGLAKAIRAREPLRGRNPSKVLVDEIHARGTT
jgi:hypothetical protein